MTRANKTRSALFTSIMSLLLCVSMLVGTTFAWFTDIAESGLNQIIAGNLDVALLDKMGNSVEGDTELFTMPELWEPGAVAYAQIQVSNVGNLDLKASLSINYEDVNSLNGHVLSEVLKYAIIDATNVDLTSREAVLAAAKASTNKGALSVYDFDIELEPGEKSALQTLVIYWEPQGDNVDNLYNANNGQQTSNGKPLQINLGVRVFATQLGGKDNNENDSFGPDYDENAPTIIRVEGSSTVYATIGEAFAATGKTTFQVSGPIDVTKMGDLFKTANQNVSFKQIEGASAAYYDFSNAAINANGANITIEGGYIQGMRSNTGNGFGFQHTAGTITYKGVTINDSWTNEHQAVVRYENCVFTGTYYIWTYGNPNVTFKDCIFDREDSRAILVYGHGTNIANTVTISGCKFYADAKGYTGVPAWTAAVEVDASNIPAGVTVNITDCETDSNYNGIVRDKSGVNAYIYVEGDPVVTSQAAFEKAIADGSENIYLAAGNYTMVNTNYDVTISGTNEAILSLPNGVSGNGNTITFEGITINGYANNDTWYTTQLNGAEKAIYKNCTINDLITTYCPSDFVNCVFENHSTADADWYSVFDYGVSEVNITDCTFNTTASKAIKIFTEGDKAATLNVTNCEFNGSFFDKAAIEIDSTYCKTTKYTVNITGCKMNEWYERLYNDKSTKSVVTVDGNHMNPSAPTVETIKTAEELKKILTNASEAGSGNYVINIEANIDLTGEVWTPVKVDGYNGAGIVTINGNNHTIVGLSAPLYAGGFAGSSGIVIKDLTIQNSNIVSTNTQGSGAFIECVDSMPQITLSNCHLLNSTVQGSRTGGLIGWTSGYNNTNDGAVDTYVTIENCSVIGCTIESTISDENTTHTESLGAIIGHAGANPATHTNITNCIVKNNKLISAEGKTGVILGTANLGEVIINGCTVEGNTINGVASDKVYGRTSFGETGSLTVDGEEIK